MIVGAMTTIIFHIGVREPLSNNRVNRSLLMTETEAERASNSVWSMFKRVTLYQTAIIYMCSRITVNMTLVNITYLLVKYFFCYNLIRFFNRRCFCQCIYKII